MKFTIDPICQQHDRQRERGQEECDDPDCAALKNPVTHEELSIALEHWQTHSLMSGCAHGC